MDQPRIDALRGQKIGAVTSHEQRQSDLGSVARAQAEGARLIAGGKALHGETGGFSMQPTILDKVTCTMEIFQRKVFGPVLTITPFDSEEEALAGVGQSGNGADKSLHAMQQYTGLKTAWIKL